MKKRESLLINVIGVFFILLGIVSIAIGGYELTYGTHVFGPIINIALGVGIIAIFGTLCIARNLSEYFVKNTHLKG